MSRIQCLLLEPTNRVRQKLRRFAKTDEPCPAMPGDFSYHNAEVPVEDAEAIYDPEYAYIRNGIVNLPKYEGDPRWPTHCACGFEFIKDDVNQLFTNLIYRRTDTGEETTLRDAPAGAMWRNSWWLPQQSQDDGAPLYMKLPDGTDWGIDGHANNCTIPDDLKQERHHCWPRRGVPPNITVDKDYGPTCSAGAGSIASPGYHGFLRNGWLESC